MADQHAYWRLTGFLTDSNALELSQAQLYDGAQLIAETPTFTVPPTTGAAFPDTLHWDDFSMPGFALVWNLATAVENPNLRLGAGSSADNFPKEFYCQYSDDGLFWSTNNAPTNVAFPGAGLMTAVPGVTAAIAGDPDFSKVSLLLAGSSTDKSPVAAATSIMGPVSTVATPVKFPATSLFFSGDATLVVPSSEALDLAGVDFTIEAWVYLPALGNSMVVLNKGGVGGQFYPQYEVAILAGGTLRAFLGASYEGATVLQAGQWHHIAVGVYGDLCFGYVNGVPQWSSAKTAMTANTRHLFVSGQDGYADQYFAGYIAELRITKGLARYPSSFIPPVAAFPTAQSSAASDSEFSKVTLLLRDSLADRSALTKTVTVHGAAAVSTANAKFGGASFSFDGAASSFLSSPANPAWAFGTDDFTVEGWLWRKSAQPGDATIVKSAPNKLDALCIGLTEGGKLFSGPINRSYGVISPEVVPVASWVHFAVCRASGVTRLFVGGILVASGADTYGYLGENLCIGGGGIVEQKGIDAYLDDLRITKGLARYVNTFAPPAAAYPHSENIDFIPLSETPQAKRWRLVGRVQERIAGSELPAHNLREVTMETSFMDAYHGGNGRLYGTVKEKHAPLDIPLRREVLLIDKASRLTIRVTWSDPLTGDYEFIGIRMGVKYTVLAYDHFGIYRVVGADGQIPESMT